MRFEKMGFECEKGYRLGDKLIVKETGEEKMLIAYEIEGNESSVNFVLRANVEQDKALYAVTKSSYIDKLVILEGYGHCEYGWYTKEELIPQRETSIPVADIYDLLKHHKEYSIDGKYKLDVYETEDDYYSIGVYFNNNININVVDDCYIHIVNDNLSQIIEFLNALGFMFEHINGLRESLIKQIEQEQDLEILKKLKKIVDRDFQ